MGNAISLDSSAGWVQLSIDVSNPPQPPPGYDPCDVREIDVSVQTGGTGTYPTAVMHIDTITIGVPGGVIDDAGTPDTGSLTPHVDRQRHDDRCARRHAVRAPTRADDASTGG